METREPKPYAFTPYLQASVAVGALLIGIAAAGTMVNFWFSERNARLVEIGISVLRADPKKEPSAAAARKWALDLIDANAGGVKFSQEAREVLINEALSVRDSGGGGGNGGGSGGGDGGGSGGGDGGGGGRRTAPPKK